jgi:hypothetical protein
MDKESSAAEQRLVLQNIKNSRRQNRSKKPRGKAPEIRGASPICKGRRSDEDEGNSANGCFSWGG